MIDGIEITTLKQMHDDRGAVFHMLRSDTGMLDNVAEIYFSIVNPGVIKGWKQHKTMRMRLAVPKGKLKFVMYDERENSPTKGVIQEIEVGENESDYKLINVPPLIWSSFQCISSESAIVCNCASVLHDPAEVDLLPIENDKIKYNW